MELMYIVFIYIYIFIVYHHLAVDRIWTMDFSKKNTMRQISKTPCSIIMFDLLQD